MPAGYDSQSRTGAPGARHKASLTCRVTIVSVDFQLVERLAAAALLDTAPEPGEVGDEGLPEQVWGVGGGGTDGLGGPEERPFRGPVAPADGAEGAVGGQQGFPGGVGGGGRRAGEGVGEG